MFFAIQLPRSLTRLVTRFEVSDEYERRTVTPGAPFDDAPPFLELADGEGVQVLPSFVSRHFFVFFAWVT
jgi:hypothetical protein